VSSARAIQTALAGVANLLGRTESSAPTGEIDTVNPPSRLGGHRAALLKYPQSGYRHFSVFIFQPSFFSIQYSFFI
jgi:hypothetical protein